LPRDSPNPPGSREIALHIDDQQRRCRRLEREFIRLGIDQRHRI
jgi:hypothetical protein